MNNPISNFAYLGNTIYPVESSKLGSILEDIEKEEPASDEQVQQFEDYEEQILTVKAGIYVYHNIGRKDVCKLAAKK